VQELDLCRLKLYFARQLHAPLACDRALHTCSSPIRHACGLGRSILEAALHDGGKALATARDTTRFANLRARYGEHLDTFELDVTNEQQATEVGSEAVRRFGQLDALVKTPATGLGHIQPFEHTSAENFRADRN